MKSSIVIEIAQFKLNRGVNDFLVEAENVTNLFLIKQKGYIDREFIKNENGVWLDILHWGTMKDALAAADNIMNDPSVATFGQMLDPDSIQMNHYTQGNAWK